MSEPSVRSLVLQEKDQQKSTKLRKTKSTSLETKPSKPKAKKLIKTKSQSTSKSVFLTSSDNEKFKSNSNWLKILQPNAIDELVIHPKKLEDIKNWFLLTRKSPSNRILLLIGPAGSSKATVVRIVGKEAGYKICEYINNQEEFYDDDDDEDRQYNYQKQGDKFADYLKKCSRYPSVFSQDQRLVVVKDFPNIFLRKGNEEEFWKILKDFKSCESTPLIFIITSTHSKSTNIEFLLFTDAIRSQLGIDTINMNSISLTMMKKALKRACDVMQSREKSIFFQTPSLELLESIATQSQGDIRNAILNLNLHIASQQGAAELDLALPTIEKTKKIGKEEKAQNNKVNQGLGRNEILDIFHGVGRVLYPKFEMNPQTNQVELTHKPETIAEIFSTQPRNFIELLHSNYMKNFSVLEDVSEVADTFSLSDTFQAQYRESEGLHFLNLNMIIRGTMVLNTKKKPDFRPVTSYANKKYKALEEKNTKLYFADRSKHNGHIVSKNDFFLDYSIFSNILTCDPDSF